jgi:hypothetical protein
MIDSFKKFWQSKTFGFLAVAFFVGTVLLIFGKLASNEWIQLVQFLGAGATVRGTAEQVGNTIAAKKDSIEKNLDTTSDADLASGIVAATDK